MFGKMKRNLFGGFAVLAAAVVSAGLAQSARADMAVTYTTVGSFDTTAFTSLFDTFTTGTNLSSITGVNTDSGETVTLEFIGVTTHSETLVGTGPWATLPLSPGLLGNFKITTSGGATDGGELAKNIKFSINIFQINPGNGNVGDLIGKVTVDSVTVQQGSATIKFNGIDSVSSITASASSPPVTYTLNSLTYVVNTPPSGGIGTTNVYANLSAPSPFGDPPSQSVPLPAIASMGVPMFGLLAGGLLAKKGLRRRVARV